MLFVYSLQMMYNKMAYYQTLSVYKMILESYPVNLYLDIETKLESNNIFSLEECITLMLFIKKL
jgi:hypothetical protein